MSLENIYESLNDEQLQQARECKTPEEMLALSKKWGIQLSDEELGSISGGSMWSNGCDYCLSDSEADS